MSWIAPAGTGFLTAISLIFAIGAQNAFVLRQGLMRSHVFAICLTCAMSDAILITIGVAGFGAASERYPWLPEIMLWGGAAFLIGYGATRLWAAWNGSETMELSGQAKPLIPALLACLAFTWLNPHVYLDTVALIGAIATQFAPGADRTAYGIGAVTASFVFFFSLGYGARLLAPVMTTARAWQMLDAAIGLLMWVLAAGLLISGV